MLSRKGLNTGDLVFTKQMEGLKEQILGWNTGVIPVRMQSWPPGELLPLGLPPAEWGWSRTLQQHLLLLKKSRPKLQSRG